MPHIHLGGPARTIAFLLVVTSCTRAVMAAQNSSTSEQLTADTPKQTTAGATFIAPAGWTFSVRGPATILAPPEGDSHIALVDVRMTVGAELANATLARALKRPVGSPIVRTRLAYRSDGDQLVEVAITEYPADSFSRLIHRKVQRRTESRRLRS